MYACYGNPKHDFEILPQKGKFATEPLPRGALRPAVRPALPLVSLSGPAPLAVLLLRGKQGIAATGAKIGREGRVADRKMREGQQILVGHQREVAA